MTQASDMFDAGLEEMHAVSGVAITYTEAGVAGQAVTATVIRETVRGDDIQKSFMVRLGELTVSDTAWRGATITDAASKVYRIEKRTSTPGTLTFTGVRPLERS